LNLDKKQLSKVYRRIRPSNLLTVCRKCKHPIDAVDGMSGYGVLCRNKNCGHFETGRDYLSRCVGGAAIGWTGGS